MGICNALDSGTKATGNRNVEWGGERAIAFLVRRFALSKIESIQRERAVRYHAASCSVLEQVAGTRTWSCSGGSLYSINPV